MSRPFIAVELDSPANNRASQQGLDTWLASARALAAGGADAITIADNPLALPRADAATLAAVLWREAGIPAIPHLACRDRNRNALLSSLLALDLLGIHDILAVTGDPIRAEDRGSVKSLAAFDSSAFASLISEWNDTLFSSPFSVSGALNLNAANFDAELAKADKKIKAGVSRFFTQPIHSERALRNLERAGTGLGAAILAGILPIVSRRNAVFLAEKVPGMQVDGSIVDRYEGADAETATELAVTIALGTAMAARAFVDGFYVITPFRRIDIVLRIVGQLAKPDVALARAV